MKKAFLMSVFALATLSINAQTATTDPGVVINGVKWATRNVDKPGTFAAKSQSSGMFYQWNNPKAWDGTDKGNRSDGDGSWDNQWERNGAKIWAAENNVCPAGWRIPTAAELTSLIEAGNKWVETPAPGRIFGSGTNTIFLPAAGNRMGHNGRMGNVKKYGEYWSNEPNTTRGIALTFEEDDAWINELEFPKEGFNVRCVAEK